MPALIPELVSMASDPTVKTTDLLRRALVAAHRLQQPEWVTWLEHELNGYGPDDSIPDYRHLKGEVLLDGHTWMEGVQFPSANEADFWQLCKIDTAIAEIEGWVEEGGELFMRIPARPADLLRTLFDTKLTPTRRFSLACVKRIIAAVKTQVLSWALKLECAGILGEGMSFTSQEQQKAQQLVPVTHILIHGNVHNSQLMVGSPGGQQQQTVTGEQKAEALNALLPWLQKVIEQEQLQREDCAELQAELDTLRAQAASPKPKWPVIGTVASSVRTILEGAGGELLAGQALGWLATLTAV